MRACIVLCLVASVCADKLGYNYQPVAHSDSGLSFAPGGVSGGVSGGVLGGVSGGVLGGVSGGVGSLGGVSGVAGIGGVGDSGSAGGLGGDVGSVSYGAPAVGSGSVGPSYSAPAVGSGSVGPSYSAPAEYEKEFYTYSAPEQDFSDVGNAQDAVNSLKKNLRVIFIKGPENHGFENAVLNLAKQAAEDKTAIYVLQKQSDIGDLANKLNAVQDINRQKPEVHFVKYRTPEDAANAQHAIQSQYDQLAGNSQSHDGGVAPVHNFASQAPVQAPVVNAPGSSYLPSSVIRV